MYPTWSPATSQTWRVFNLGNKGPVASPSSRVGSVMTSIACFT